MRGKEKYPSNRKCKVLRKLVKCEMVRSLTLFFPVPSTDPSDHECLSRGVSHCGECLAAGPHCAWCTEEVSGHGNALCPLRPKGLKATSCSVEDRGEGSEVPLSLQEML